MSALSSRRIKTFGALVLALSLVAPVTAEGPQPVRFTSHGELLPGPQFRYDAGFELLDFNGDGRLDLFLPNTGMISFAVHLNIGTRQQPRFGFAVGYPVNLTETKPQTLEHIQAMAVGDLDGDGLFDLVVFDGQLRLVRNVGTPHGPNHWHLAKVPQYFPASERMIRENARYSTGPESMYWNKGIFARQVLTMSLADWDGDGLDDLLVCRLKDEAPGVKPAGGAEQWTSWGRAMISRPKAPPPPVDAPTYLEPLSQAPERGLYFYKNAGTRQKPWFDQGVEILTPDGKSIAAPNPVVVDLDADGAPDLLSTETQYACNAFRVDWPTLPHVVWLRRPAKDRASVLQPAQPVTDAEGQPIPAGVQARVADLRGSGVKDLLVMDAGRKGSIRWYRNQAQGSDQRPVYARAETLHGSNFLRFDFMAQPLVVDWFGPGSRDLVLHGCNDAHCKFALRRTALYRNVAPGPGRVQYEFVGLFNYRGDLAMVPPSFEERPYDVYGSAISMFPDAGDGKKRLLMSVDGKLYLFSNLAPDGFTFLDRQAIPLAAQRNRKKGWQEIAVDTPGKTQFIRIGNDRNGMGNLRDAMLHILNFEALAQGKNWATVAEGVQIADDNKQPSPNYRVRRPMAMFARGNEPSDEKPNFTSFGYYIGPAVITLKEPVKLERIRFLLSDREERWYTFRLPVYWQGTLYRDGTEQGEPWYQYKVEVSADGNAWTTVADTMQTEMMRSFPHLVDWDRDGKVDLVLGVLNSRGIWPATKEYRLYRNRGSNHAPKFDDFEPFCDEHGKPLTLQAAWNQAYAIQCGVIARDLDGDGRCDLVVEDLGFSRLLWYRNVSDGATKGLRLQKAGELGAPRAVSYRGRYRYFGLGDADGDGIEDLVDSSGAMLSIFKGIAAAAPAASEDLAARSQGTAGISLQWSRPAAARSYEVRWSEAPVTELAWEGLPGTTGTYAVEVSSRQQVLLDRLPQGKILHLAVKSRDGKGRAGPLSNIVQVATSPLRRIVLRNGPALPDVAPAYCGNQSCYLDAQRPDSPAPRKPSVLLVRAQTPKEEKQKVILVRFADLPGMGDVESAALELTTDPSIARDAGSLEGPATLAVSCNAIRDDWDVQRATFVEVAPGNPWAPDELDAGGRFLAMARPEFTVAQRRTLSWDVTEEVRRAQREGRRSISLLVRVDYTGYYIAGQGYNFCGSDFPAEESRPRLCLITAGR